MKFENIQVMNFKNALKGMRNPKESWKNSDSVFGLIDLNDCVDFEVAETWVDKCYKECKIEEERENKIEEFAEWLRENGVLQIDYSYDIAEVAFIGPDDMLLAQKLIKSGPEHRKFMSLIFVSVDITAPLYWWKEFDTYKVGTVANSTSTMHKITSKPITIDCFEIDDYINNLEWTGVPVAECINGYDSNKSIMQLIDMLEGLRLKYLETKDVRYWKELIRWLPESWLQTRTVTMNYENLFSMVLHRGYHKLKAEWCDGFIKWCTTLPYAKEIIFYGEERKKIYSLYAQK